MARWISSKLKVAENLLQQIDQQAAESLGKAEIKQSEELNFESPVKPSGSVSLKHQLKKKTTTQSDIDPNRKPIGEDCQSVDNELRSSSGVGVSGGDRGRGISDLNPRSDVADSDWTELLSTPKRLNRSRPNRGNGQNGLSMSGGRGARRDGGKIGSLGSNSKSAVHNSGLVTGSSGTGVGAVNRVAVKVDGGLWDSGRRNGKNDSRPRMPSSVPTDKPIEGWEFGQKLGFIVNDDGDQELEFGRERVTDGLAKDTQSNSENTVNTVVLRSMDENLYIYNEPTKSTGGRNEVHYNKERSDQSIGRQGQPNTAIAHILSGDLGKSSYLRNDEESDSQSESGSTSDSEIECGREERRKSRQQILAAKVASKAAKAIKDCENLVARLEGEKEILEKILEERAKQAAQEASELQSVMMEMMEAVELEKQKHNNTRMEALARLAKLETMNADLARSLARAQWNLEVEVNQVAELRKQVELREISCEELRRKIASTQKTAASLGSSIGAKGVKLEHQMMVAEFSFVINKVKRLKEKELKLKELIETTQKEVYGLTEVEVEIKQQLAQMTDHLIQKQSQVEALSSERAMLLFGIEAISTLLDENKSPATSAGVSGSSQGELEKGKWEISISVVKPMLQGKFLSGRQHLGSLVRQLDAIFAAGAVLLRRKPEVKLLSIIYLSCLHFWVLYILFSHSQYSAAAKSGAVFSLENINASSGK